MIEKVDKQTNHEIEKTKQIVTYRILIIIINFIINKIL